MAQHAMREALWWAKARLSVELRRYVDEEALAATVAWWAAVAGHHGRKALKEES